MLAIPRGPKFTSSGYTLDEVQASGMRCASFTLRAGETLYLPKGAVHQTAAGSTGSARVTLTLAWAGVCWTDMLGALVARLPGLAQRQGADGDQTRGTPDQSLADGLGDALQVAQKQPHGIVLHRPVLLLAEIVSRQLTERDYARLSQVMDVLLGMCAMALNTFFGDTPPGMARAIAVAQQVNHTAWLHEYTDDVARDHVRMMQGAPKPRESGTVDVETATAMLSHAWKHPLRLVVRALEEWCATAGPSPRALYVWIDVLCWTQPPGRLSDSDPVGEWTPRGVEIAWAVYNQHSMVAFEQGTTVAFEQAMAAKGQLVAYAAQFPDVDFSVEGLTAGDPEFLLLETGWMMRDFEHKVVSGAILPKLRPRVVVRDTATGANSGANPAEKVSSQQGFPIHQSV